MIILFHILFTGLTVATVPANSATDHMDSIAVTTADSQDMDSSQGSLTITQVKSTFPFACMSLFEFLSLSLCILTC